MWKHSIVKVNGIFRESMIVVELIKINFNDIILNIIGYNPEETNIVYIIKIKKYELIYQRH